MTREEAIAKLHWLKAELIKGTDLNEPIDMAIEALKAEPTKGGDAETKPITNGVGYTQHSPDNGADYISRTDAIKAICDKCLEEHCETECIVPCTFMEALEAVPSADAEPKWNCTANFIAEQLEWLKDMTDEERLKLLQTLFPSADAEHDGCDGCRYEQNTEYEYPCNECKQTYTDMWTQKPNGFVEVVRCKDCKHSFYDKDYGNYTCRKHEYVECFNADDYCSWGEKDA